MVRVGREIEMIDCDVAALTDVLEGYGAPDSCCATGYGGSFGEEEVVRHVELAEVWWVRMELGSS